MKNGRKTFVVAIATAMTMGNALAQDNVFDLSSQRKEKQHVAAVPGKKMDHKGLVINPQPQQMELLQGSLDISRGLALKDKKKKFGNDFGFMELNAKGVKTTIDFGEKVAAKNGVKAVSGAYALSIGEKGISIIGYDERGAFYGIQTLRQIMESPVAADGKFPYLQMNDYPNLPNRGVVEGFYGTPWSHQVRISLIDFYGKFKMNTYLYGPKDDPYHSCPNWRKPYPEKEAQNIKELVDACNRNRVDFVWAIHPGADIKWNEEDYTNLVNKLNWMYDLGVRDFALFFDDISGEGTNPEKQAELLNRLDKEFVKAKKDVSPLTFCPTDYSKLWANPTPQGSLAIFGNKLNKDIKIFWTGDYVCSDMTKETMDWFNSRIQRPGYYWWNYPVTDYVRHIILQGPVYGLDTGLTEQDVCGLISNPMEHGEASKLALYGVADYAWNIAGYNALDNWERGLVELAPKASEAYRTFAIHSSDTETGYRRDESWETQTFTMDEWTDEAAKRLEAEYKKVEAAPSILESQCENKALLSELRPWLVEFGKLGNRGKQAIELGRMYRTSTDDAAFWNKYVNNLMSEDQMKAYDKHKSGTMKLQPFYANAMDYMAHGFVKKLSGKVPADYKGIGTFANSFTISTKLMLDNDAATFYTTGQQQSDGSWIGLDLRAVREVKNVTIIQGRNSVDDVDYFDHAIVEYSEDGKQWKALTGELKQQYDIHWEGEAVRAQYIRLRRLDSTRKNYAAVRSFEVNKLKACDLPFSLDAAGKEEALFAFDNNPTTAFRPESGFSFGVAEGTTGYQFLLGKNPGRTQVCQYDKDGKKVDEKMWEGSFLHVKVVEGAVTVKVNGKAEIYEIIGVGQ